MTLKVYTSRMIYAGKDALDVTRSGNDPTGVIFAPSWSIVQPYLNARQAGLETPAPWRTYEANYRREMIESLKAHPVAWTMLLERESVTLLCFCANADRCHRTVLASILEGMGAQRMGERQLSLF